MTKSHKSPTSRTLERCRDRGYRAAITEKRVFGATSAFGVTKDLFGFIDVLALTPEGFLGIQTTTVAHATNRIAKITGECHDAAVDWLKAGGKIEVWAWRKLAKRGEDGRQWQVKIYPVGLEQCDA